MSIDLYQKHIAEFQKTIDGVLELCKKYNDKNHINQLKLLKKAIDEDVFRLLVVGEFSRGKSTLVNALLGKNILPADPNPTTVMLNVIHDGNDDAAYFIHYKDNTVKEVTCDGFKAMVAKEPSPDKSQKDSIQELYADATRNAIIDYAEIVVKNDFGKLGIDIVDTPGMNDINTVREEITLNYIPKADAAIIVCSALEPLSRSEFKFIKDQLEANQITNLFVAVNYCDLLKNEADRKRIFNHFKEGLNQIISPDRIKLVSAKKALKYKRQLAGETFKKTVSTYEESGFDSFESDILEHLAVERGTIKLQRFSSILTGILDDISNSTLEMRKQAVMLSREKLEEQILEIKNKTKELERRYKRELEVVSVELLKKQSDYAKEYEKCLRSMANAAMDKVDAYRGNDMEEMYEIISDVIIWHKRKLDKEFLNQIKTNIENTFAEHTERFGDEFAEIGLPNNPLMIQIEDSSTDMILYKEQEVVDMLSSKKGATDESVEDFLIGAAVGVGVIALGALIVSNPVLLVGAAIISRMGNSGDNTGPEEQTQESNAIETTQSQVVITNDMVKAVYEQEIKKCYFSPISSNVAKFREEYEESIHRVVEKMEQDCLRQMDNLTRQFELELDEKADKKTEIQNKLAEIKNDANSLIDIKIWCGGFV